MQKIDRIVLYYAAFVSMQINSYSNDLISSLQNSLEFY